MPVHDWSRMPAGDFHHFHQAWIGRLAAQLNGGLLPPGCNALMEQPAIRSIPEFILPWHKAHPEPPRARIVQTVERHHYANRKDRVIIRYRDEHGGRRGRVIAIIELVSPGNKSGRRSFRSFIEKTADILNQGIHLVVVDLFPPTPRDPVGIHKEVMDEFEELPFEFLPDKPLTVASYIGGDLTTAYVETIGLGDAIPSIPLFLTQYDYVPCPLEESYMQAWAVFPEMLKDELLAASP